MVKRPRKKRPSMQDVAELAGVSRTAVSFVLNDKPGTNIPKETQERIWAAVRKLGYRPNAIARGLRSQKSSTIGFISDVVATTPYAGLMIQGAQERAWEENYLLLLVNTGNNPRLKQAAVDTLLDRQVDGIIYATMYHRAVTPPDNIRDVPVVLLDCFVADRSLPSIVPDEVRGGFEATTHLLAKGHRRIGFINDEVAVAAHVGRLEGYKQALAAYDISFDPDLVQHGPTTPAGGLAAAQKLMALPDRPTGVFCFNDRMAMGAYEAVHRAGLMIPADLAIVSFDNQEILAGHSFPPLSSMELPHYQMGQWAVQHLLKLMQQSAEQNAHPVQQLMHCPLVERDSA